MAGRKNNDPAVEARQLRIFKGWAAGTSTNDLAEAEGISQRQAQRDLVDALAKIRPLGSWKNVEKIKMELLDKTIHAETELLGAWERSKKPKERRKGKTTEPTAPPPPAPDGQSATPDAQPARGRRSAGGKTESEKVVEGRDGNPRFIEALQRLWEFRAKVLGLLRDQISKELAAMLEEVERRIKDRGFDV
jgi:hypothetical protein